MLIIYKAMPCLCGPALEKNKSTQIAWTLTSLGSPATISLAL